MKDSRIHNIHPLLSLCLSMVWVSAASEAAHFSEGRFSVAGSNALMGLAAGLIIYCVVSAVIRDVCGTLRKYSPLVSAVLCIAMLLPFAKTAIAVLFGVSCGLFFASSLVGYLPHAGDRNRMLKIGFSAGLFTVAVYPFGAIYSSLSPIVTLFALRCAVFLPLFVLAIFIFFTQGGEPEHKADQADARAKTSPVACFMIVAVVALAMLNHLLNSGVLEQNGGTASAPLIFFINVLLRLPMGVLMGYWADRRRWHLAVGLPLMLMICGCAVSLFAGGTVGDFFMLGVFNCGGAAIVILIHILAMQTAMWRNKNAVAACFGAMTHFILVAFFNINTLGVAPSYFGETLRRPLTLAVIIVGLPTFWLIVHFIAREQQREIDSLTSQVNAIKGKVGSVGEFGMEDFGFTIREAEVFRLILYNGTIAEIASKLYLSEVTVKRHVSSILKKTKTQNRAALINRFGIKKEPPVENK